MESRIELIFTAEQILELVRYEEKCWKDIGIGVREERWELAHQILKALITPPIIFNPSQHGVNRDYPGRGARVQGTVIAESANANDYIPVEEWWNNHFASQREELKKHLDHAAKRGEDPELAVCPKCGFVSGIPSSMKDSPDKEWICGSCLAKSTGEEWVNANKPE